MARLKSFSILAVLVGLVAQAECKLSVADFSRALSQQEVSIGKTGFGCLKELFGEEGEHILTQDPTAGIYHDVEATMSDKDRYEAIYLVFGEAGIETMCDVTERLRKARFLSTVDPPVSMMTKPQLKRRAQACVQAQPLYPSENDADNSYNAWAAAHIDQFLPDGADRTSRTDPNKLIMHIQDSIDVAMEAEYASMACHPLFKGIEAIASIPDFVVLQQGSIVGGIKQFVCGFGTQVASYTTGNLYRQLARARFHDLHIDGAEERATYMNTNNMVNQVCGSRGRLNDAVGELASIKRELESRRR